MSKLHAFDPGLDSLDGELASFIANLIDQNAELAAKLQHIDSLTELAENTVIQAGKEAERIKSEAEKEANASVADIVARAAERGPTLKPTESSPKPSKDLKIVWRKCRRKPNRKHCL